MDESRIATFFYGSYINQSVLRGLGVEPADVEVARLDGFDIRIAPLANLVRAEGSSVHGIVVSLTPRELVTLYAHARDVLGGTYHPEAVVVETVAGEDKAARCYIAPAGEAKPAHDDYIERIVAPAREYGFPAEYIAKLESFRAEHAGG
jgi:hypothetical protein